MPGVKVDFENSKVRAKLGLFVIGNGSSPRAVIVWKLESTMYGNVNTRDSRRVFPSFSPKVTPSEHTAAVSSAVSVPTLFLLHDSSRDVVYISGPTP